MKKTILPMVLAPAWTAAAGDFDVRDFGAKAVERLGYAFSLLLCCSRRQFRRSVLVLGAVATFALAADAGKPSIGQYLSAVRGRVTANIREALAQDGTPSEVTAGVTVSGDGVFFMQRSGIGLKVVYAGDLPHPGDVVTVRGKPSLEGARIVFHAAGWQRKGRGDLPAAKPAGASELTDASVRGGINWLRVTLEGRAIGPTETGFALNVDDLPVNVMVRDLPTFLRDCDRTHPKVKVTGVAELMLDASALLDGEGYVMGVKLNVQAPADIALEPDVAYLVACRDRRVERIVLAVVSVLAVGLFVFAVVIFRQRRGQFRMRTIMAERKRMADDIHDTIEQHLVGAGMLLKINRLKEAQEVLVRAKREIRDIVWGLKNDDMMRQTPAEMLRQLAHEENTKGLYRVDTRLGGLPAAMDAAQMRDLSLIVREAIGNAVKHGGAKKIAISCDAATDGGWTLRLSNDGTPFDPESAPGAREGHFGLEGMRQRARRLGAALRFERRGAGMVLIIERTKEGHGRHS